jgi:hypothetical protein
MQTIEFLRNLFTKGLEIHFSFLSYVFQIFQKNKNFKNKNFKNKNLRTENLKKKSNLKNQQISNLKITEF